MLLTFCAANRLRIGSHGDLDRDNGHRPCEVGFEGCFPEFGVSVSCVDLDAAKIAGLQRGKMPIYEAALAAAGAARAARIAGAGVTGDVR